VRGDVMQLRQCFIWLIHANDTRIAGGGERYSLTSRYAYCRDISQMATHIAVKQVKQVLALLALRRDISQMAAQIAETRIAIRIWQKQESVAFSSLEMQACTHSRRHNDIHTQHATRNCTDVC
jgi:hypothetical protein